MACKLRAEAYVLKAFLAERTPEQIVFLGKVVAVEPIPTSTEGVASQIIHFKVSRWWRGEKRDQIIAIGVQGSAKGSSCEGVFDFEARIGQEFLIVGYEISGEIRPSKRLSIEVQEWKLPEDVRILLGESK